MLAVDYSWGRPPPAALAAAGVVVACRYLTGYGKAVSRAEIDALHAHGIGVLLNFEEGTSNTLGGARQGQIDGARARAAARALGAPVGTPLYASVDFDVTWQIPTVLSYLHGFDDPAYPARTYAEYDVMQAYARYGWQPFAWSNGRISDHAVLYQYRNGQTIAGSAVDFNEIRDVTHLGAWWPPGSSHAPAPTPVPTPSPTSEDDMYSVIYSDQPGHAHIIQQGSILTLADGNSETYALKQGAVKLRWSESHHAQLRAKLAANNNITL